MRQKNKLTLQYIQLLLARFGVRAKINKQREGKFQLYNLEIFGRDAVKYAEEIGMSASDKHELLEKWITHYKNTYTKEMIPINRRLVWNFIKEVGLSPSKIIKPRPASYMNIGVGELRKIISALNTLNITDEDIKKKIRFLASLANSDIRWEKVRKIKVKENKEPLFDLSVPENRNYIANGFVVHNSQFRVYLRKSKAGKRIGRLIDSPYLPEGEAVFKVTEKGIEDA